MKKVSVVHVRDSCGLYGAERVILAIARYLNRKEFNFTLVTLRSNDSNIEVFVDAARMIGVKVVDLPVRGRFDLKAISKFRHILKDCHADIVHSHDFKSNFYSIAASVNLPVRKIVTSHGSTRDSLLKKIYLFLDEKIFYRFFDIIIAVSKNMQTFLVRKKVRNDKILVIQNGIDVYPIENYDELAQAKPFIEKKNDTIIFGVIGRLYPDKGHRFFIRAFVNVFKKHPKIRAVIVGDGPVRREIEAYLKRLDLEKKIHIVGVRKDMNNVYDQIDYIVIPSLREGLPYVLLESMSKRIPVLATSVGDIPKLVIHGKTGYLVEPADEEALTTYMEKLLEDPDGAKGMAIRAYTNVIENYSAGKMVRKIEKIYNQL